MQQIWESIVSFLSLIWYIISGIRFVDILDIIVITFLIYKCIGFFRESRGGQLVKGIVMLFVVGIIAGILDMVMVNWLLTKLMDSILIVAVVIFQPELRRVLEHVGTSRLGSMGRATDIENERLEMQIQSACSAAAVMQDQKCGALMVFERKTQLGEIISTGTIIDAKSSSQLICNIFYPKSPLHDGAMIMRDGKVYAAGCILPLTPNNGLNKSLGTRHRAAIGMSENSDAVVVVVSEETGTVSVAVNGELKRGFDAITLNTELSNLLLSDISESDNKGFWRSLILRFSFSKNKDKKEKNNKLRNKDKKTNNDKNVSNIIPENPEKTNDGDGMKDDVSNGKGVSDDE